MNIFEQAEKRREEMLTFWDKHHPHENQVTPETHGQVSFIDEPQSIAIMHIREERIRQDKKWGVQNHADMRWLPILVEEVGELAKALNEGTMTGGELTQVAAVALAWMECHERNRKAPMGLPEMPPPDAPPCGRS